jgi:hypothetical protein
MAKVKMGVVVTGLRGTVGGLTFSANRAGNHAHVWTRSGNARSSLQSGRRQILSVNAQGWRDLDAGSKVDWDDFAKALAQRQTDPFGQYYYLSGFQWFVRCNNWIATVGRAPIDVPPVSVIPTAPGVLLFQISAADSYCGFNYLVNQFGPTWDAVVFVGMGAGHGCIVAPGPVPLIVGSQVPGGTELAFTTEFFNVFGSVTLQQRAFWRVCRQTIDGYRGAAATGWADVIA